MNAATATPLDPGFQDAPPPPRAAAGVRRQVSPRTVLAIASLGASVAFVDATIVNIAFPNIARSFRGTPISSLSWILNVYNIVFAAFLVAAGRLADLLGRRRLFLLGLQLFTISSVLCAAAPSVVTLIAFRALQALGAALLVPSALALVLNAFPPARRSHGVALLSAVAAGAAGLGPSLGGVLVALADWRLVFLVNVPIGVAASVLARRHLVESRTPGRRRLPDLTGALVFALAVSALVLGVVKGQEWGWDSIAIVLSFALAIALGALFAWRCSWHRAPVVDLAMLRVRSFSAANAMTVVAAAGFYGYTLSNVLFLTGVWHYSVLKAGLALTPGPFVAAAVAGPTSRLVQRFGHRPVLVAGGLIWGGAVLWLVERVGARPEFLSQWLPGIVLLGLGAGTLFPNLSGAALAAAPGANFATATALNSVARQLGAALGVAVVVAIIGTPSPLSALHTFEHAWSFGAGCMFVAAAGSLLVGRLQVTASPSLMAAAGALLRERPREPSQLTPPARARRAIVVPESCAGTRAETAGDFLAHTSLFAALEPPMRALLGQRARPVAIAAGEWLFREGEPGETMYVIRAGRLEVVDERDGCVVRELGRGEALGELALLSGATRSASVRATRASDLLAIERGDYTHALESSPMLSLALNRALAEQLRDSRPPATSARPRPVTVTLLGLTSGLNLQALARMLAEAARVHLPVTLLDGSEIAPPAQGKEPVAVYGPLLDRAEREHELVLLCAGTPFGGDAWSGFCIQQADRILAVTEGGPVPPELSAAEALRGCDLVSSGPASGDGVLHGWAEAVQPIETHLLREQTLAGDVARLARRLCGRSVGIVLSGGGARAFSHIGVLEELSGAGVEIDRVAGVSMGAFVGALFAMGMSAAEIDARCFEEWVQRRPLSDYTLPRHGLIRGQRAEQMLRRTFGAWTIEELPRSFMSGCTELRSGRLVISRWGPLWECVARSICLPVLAPPRVREREIFIDGSLVDNLPVGVMSDMGEGPVIAVDVKATFDSAAGTGRTDVGSEGPRERVRRERMPSLGETLTRVLLLGSANTSAAARRHADVLIEPRAEGVGLLEFHQIDAAREAGRVAAREALESGALAAIGA